MSNQLFDAVTRIARHEVKAVPTISVGLVTEVFNMTAGTADHSVTVELRDRGLILPKVPIAVGALGLAATPDVGDLVVVVFAEGDLHGPVVVGRLYHSDLAPPQHEAGQIVVELPPGDSNPALKMLLDSGVPTMNLQVGPDTTVEISDGLIELKSKGATVAVDATGSEEITVDVGQASLKLSANGEMTIKASNKLVIEATELELKGSATVKISGGKVDIN
ncbi:MAG: hypothetical protein KC553_02030 [Nitrospina sp.]|nr:hypothetical protein [Nitrospina sp.]